VTVLLANSSVRAVDDELAFALLREWSCTLDYGGLRLGNDTSAGCSLPPRFPSAGVPWNYVDILVRHIQILPPASSGHAEAVSGATSHSESHWFV
jgi:hypothetical protein